MRGKVWRLRLGISYLVLRSVRPVQSCVSGPRRTPILRAGTSHDSTRILIGGVLAAYSTVPIAVPIAVSDPY